MQKPKKRAKHKSNTCIADSSFGSVTARLGLLPRCAPLRLSHRQRAAVRGPQGRRDSRSQARLPKLDKIGIVLFIALYQFMYKLGYVSSHLRASRLSGRPHPAHLQGADATNKTVQEMDGLVCCPDNLRRTLRGTLQLPAALHRFELTDAVFGATDACFALCTGPPCDPNEADHSARGHTCSLTKRCSASRTARSRGRFNGPARSSARVSNFNCSYLDGRRWRYRQPAPCS